MEDFIRTGTVCAVLVALSAPALAQDTPKPQAPPPPAATTVKLTDLEKDPAKYAGKTVTVEGKADALLGPRVFTIDAGKLIDFYGDTVVIVPAPLAALVDDGTPVTVTGKVVPLLETTLQQEWGWTDDPTLVAEIRERSGIVAQTITTLKDGGKVALTIDLSTPAAPGTTRSDLDQLAKADTSTVGQRVEVLAANVESVAKDGGFWVKAGNERLFVLPESRTAAKVTPGQTVRIQGVVLPLPDLLKERLGDTATNEMIYVYAREVRPSA